ncbi:MltR family transcriptional regulator [uncultured Paludibaculum sp.]|uniref:MltR family transcriptional regulator n=1 Tax=uncultured Paludibaculum sp. TaxID=1765020 RepID=UPI00374DD92D
MVDVYATESDRAAAILAVSFVENRITDLLLQFMVERPKVADMFEGDRPLATLSAKISLAFALGLLPPNVHADLGLLRKLRNQFAHSDVAVQFSDSPARDWCSALSLVSPDSSVAVKSASLVKPRGQFLMTVAATTYYLQQICSALQNGTMQRCVAPSPVRLMQ